MRVDRLMLESFGAFTDTVYDFSPGLNLFFGENEDGKSTLIDGILLTLLGAPAGSERRQRYAPRDGRPYKAVIHITTGDGRGLRIERDLGSGGKERVGLRRGDEWVITRKRDSVLKELNLPTLDLARATAVITGAEVVLAGKDAEAAGRAVSARATSGEGNVSSRQALNRLHQRRIALENKERRALEEQFREWRRASDELAGAMATGEHLEQACRTAAERLEQAQHVSKERLPVIQAFEELTRAREAFEDCARRHAAVLVDLRSVQSKEEEIARAEKEIGPLLPLAGALTDEALARCRRLSGLLQAQGEAAAKAEESSARLSRETELSREKLALYRRAGFTEERMRELERVDRAVELARQNLAAKEAELAESAPPTRRPRVLRWLAASLAGLAGTALGLMGYCPAWLLLLGSVLACVAFWLRGRSMGERLRELRGSLEKARGEVELAEAAFRGLSGGRSLQDWRGEYEIAQALSAEIAARQAELHALSEIIPQAGEYQSELDGLLAAAGCQSLEDLEKMKAAYQDGRRRLDEARSVRDSLLRGEDIAAWRERELALAREEASAGAVLKEAERKAAGIDPAAVARFREELAGVDLAALEREAAEAEAARTQHRRSGMRKDPWEVETGLSLAEGALKENRRRAGAVRLAIELLEQAVEEVQGSLIPRIEDRASRLFARLTGDRYEGLAVRPGAEMLSVEARLGDSEIPLPILSSGTADQMYLALRLALVEALQGPEPLPLIMDDPFLTFDRPRLQHAVGLLLELSQDNQVILVTKDEVLRDLLTKDADKAQIRVQRLGKSE